MMKQLLVIAGPDEGRVFPLVDDCTLLVGRDKSAGIRLNDPAVSRLHCRLRAQTSHIVVADFNSRRGTFVNGQQVELQELHAGDVVRIGQTQLRLVTESPLPSASSDPDAGRPADASGLSQLVNTTLAHFEISELIARGRTGLVFLAHDTTREEVVALKVLWPEVAADPANRDRLARAMKAVIPLQHPNLVRVYNAGKTGAHCWVAMEHVAGSSLAQVVERVSGGPAHESTLSPGLGRGRWLLALRVAAHVGRALEFVHQHKIAHRNITPRNILVRENDKVSKLGDLMFARGLEWPVADDGTQLGDLLGDIRYMAPELTYEGGRADCRSDLYSLGAAVYALLAGQPPFTAKSLTETVAQIREKQPRPLTAYQHSIPPSFERVIVKLLQKQAKDRFQTATELLGKLERIAQEEKIKV